MKKFAFCNAKFVKTAMAPSHYPPLKNDSGQPLPEFAVAGRSNVGKSSLLNYLFQSKGLVKTSSTPGKTQAINFFTLNSELTCVDLPGYGYAKVPLAIKKQWSSIIQSYLEHRDPLKLILFLVDIRRIPTKEDIQFLEWASFYQKAVILVLTKVDKVTLNERNTNTKTILKTLNCGNLHYVHCSASKLIGRLELMKIIQEALNDELTPEDSITPTAQEPVE